MRLAIGIIVTTLTVGLLTVEVSAKHYLTHRHDRSKPINVPACDDARVLKKISRKFAWAEHHTWGTDWTIEHLSNPRLRYTNFRGPSAIAHRHCRAVAVISNGRERTVFYRVEDRMGFAGWGWNVSFCVSGLDRHRVWGANCRSLK